MVNTIQPAPDVRGFPQARAAYGPANGVGASITSPDHPNRGLWITALRLYVFFLVSRVLDLSPLWFLHIPMILLIVLILTLMTQGDLKGLLSLKIPRYFGLFTAWVLVCFPLSTWRGGSVNSVIWSLQAYAIFLIIVHMVQTPEDWRKMASSYAYGVLVAALLSFKYGQSVEGRLALNNGSLADPNEFALTLVIGLPLWWRKLSEVTAVKKAFVLLATLPIFYVFSKTGSRAGLLALASLFVVVLWFASPSQKILMSMIGIAAVFAGLAFLPAYLRVRYMTTFSSSSEDTQNAHLDQESRDRLSASIDSGNERQELLRESISMTVHHPIFGVGPGVFSTTAWEERRQKTGRGGLMLVTHNTYTQISSETGFPGIILFGTMLFYCFKYTLQDYRAQRKKNSELARDGLYILTTLTGLAIGIFFLSMGYSMLLAAVFGLAASLHNVIQNASAKEETSGEHVVPTPVIPETASPLQMPVRHRRFARLPQSATRRKNRANGTDWYARLTE